MIPGSVLASPSPRTALTPRFVIDAWRSISRREIRATMLLGCVLFFLTIARGIPLGAGHLGLPIIALGAEIEAFIVLLAFVVADRMAGGDPDRKGTYAMAVVIGAAVGSPVAIEIVLALLERFVHEQPWPFPIPLHLYRAFDLLMLSGATVWLILDRRRALRARERLHVAEQQRILAERESLQSDLQALQARVEPRFLFGTLARVRALCREDPSRGIRMLDDLIAYLRAAMPRMRDSSSTLAQEVELARAWLDIVRRDAGEPMRIWIDIPPGVGDTRMPPMTVLPLVEQAIAGRLAGTAGECTIRLSAEVTGERLRLRIAERGASPMPAVESEGIASIRERLHALFRRDATLDILRPAAGGSEFVLEMPAESAPAPDASRSDAPALDAPASPGA